MKNPFTKFEQYCKFALSTSARIAKLENHPIITPDDVFFGIILAFMETHLEDSFRALVNIHENPKLDKYLENIDDREYEYEIIHQEELKPDHYHFHAEIQFHLQPYLDNPQKNLELSHLLSRVLPLLSSPTKTLLKTKKTNYSKILEATNKLEHIPIIQELGFIPFLETLDEMLAQLDLDYSDLENMQIKIWTNEDINWLFNTLEKKISQTSSTLEHTIANGGESEIIDKPESDKKSDQSAVSTTDSKSKKKEEKKLTIEYFGTDLTKEAKDGYLDPIIGRDKEIDQVIYTLLRKTKNNPLLIGEAGVGKTAIVEGLVQRINMQKVPQKLIWKRVFLLDMGTLVAGTKYRGEFESRMKSILEEAIDPTNNIILFIDELHTIIGAWGQDQNDAAQMLKPLLSRGKIKLIGATTFDEYQKYIEKDAALKRRFQEVVVEEPSLETTKQIILGLKQIYEDFHGVALSEEAIDAAIHLSKRYILNKQLPDKALDIIDEASARKSTMQQKLDNDDTYAKQEKKIEKIQKQIEDAIENQDYFSAAELKSKEDELKKELQKIRSTKNIPMNLRSVITADDIGKVLADKTWIPTNIVNEDEITKLKRLDTELKSQITGQDEAVDSVVKTLIRSRLSVIRKNKPIGSFLFLGPSGVGKTYLAKLIAKTYFGDENAMIRFDMSEFMEKFSVSKLIGSPAGYIGYDEGGGMTEAVKRKPYSVLLLDEIEKAAPDVLNILLQILDEGQLKDSKGRRVDFKNTIIIMTSNIGTEEFSKKKSSIWFDTGSSQDIENKHHQDIKTRVLDDLKNYLTPELSNRIDHKIVFRALTKADLSEIFNQKIKTFLAARKANDKVKLPKFTKAEVEKIIDKIYDPQFWARPVERYINDEIEPEIINSLLK